MPQSLLYVQKQNEIILAIVALLLDRRSKKSIQRNSSVISLVVGNPIDHFFAQKNSDSISGAFGSQSPTTTGATVSFRTSGDRRHQKKNIQIFSIVNPPRPNSSNKSFVPRFWITFWRRRENPQAIVHSTRTHSGKWTTYLFAICSFLKCFFLFDPILAKPRCWPLTWPEPGEMQIGNFQFRSQRLIAEIYVGLLCLPLDHVMSGE